MPERSIKTETIHLLDSNVSIQFTIIFFVIKESLKQHFLTKRRKEKHIANGTHQDVLRQERRRQRINEVSYETIPLYHNIF